MKSPIPDEIWTQHVAILAKTGRGKTVAAKDGAARLMQKNHRVGAVDPTGAWWGMRLKADGRTPAFQMVIFGGDHGDIAINKWMGTKIGAMVAAADWCWILDISKMGIEDRTAFMTDFAEALFAESRRRLNLFLDECHLYMPQQKLPTRASSHMTAACNNLVSGGRSRGLCITMISQRSAKVHKDSLTQAETLIALGMIAPHDIAAVEAWVKVQGDIKAARDMLASLPALPVGTGWVYAPGLGMLDRVKFPMIDTFDSSRAPGAGEDMRAPTELGQINIEEIRAVLAPAGAKRPIRQAPPDLSTKPGSASVPVEKSNVASQKAQERALAAAREEGAAAVRNRIPALLDGQHAVSFQMGVDWARGVAITAAKAIPNPDLMPARKPLKALQDLAARAIVITPKAAPQPSRSAQIWVRPDAGAIAAAARFEGLGKAERAILNVLCHFPGEGVSKAKAALMAGYSASSGSFRNSLSVLRTGGLIHPGEPLVATDAGLEANGPVEPLPSGQALLDYWKAHGAVGKCEASILEALVEASRGGEADLDKGEVAARAGYEPTSGSFRNGLSKLRTLGLITGTGSAPLRAAEEFA